MASVIQMRKRQCVWRGLEVRGDLALCCDVCAMAAGAASLSEAAFKVPRASHTVNYARQEKNT